MKYLLVAALLVLSTVAYAETVVVIRLPSAELYAACAQLLPDLEDLGAGPDAGQLQAAQQKLVNDETHAYRYTQNFACGNYNAVKSKADDVCANVGTGKVYSIRMYPQSGQTEYTVFRCDGTPRTVGIIFCD